MILKHCIFCNFKKGANKTHFVLCTLLVDLAEIYYRLSYWHLTSFLPLQHSEQGAARGEKIPEGPPCKKNDSCDSDIKVRMPMVRSSSMKLTVRKQSLSSAPT
jgi:hypothetical protein